MATHPYQRLFPLRLKISDAECRAIEAAVRPHPFSALMPLMTEPEFTAIRENIKEHGQQEEIWKYRGHTLDGLHRGIALAYLKIMPRVREFKGTDEQAKEFVISKSTRRSLSKSQRAATAALFYDHYRAKARERIQAGPAGTCPQDETGEAAAAAGLAFGVGATYVRHALAVKKRKGLFKRVRSGEVNLSSAYRIVTQAAKRAKLETATAEVPAGTCDIRHGLWQKVMDREKAKSIRLAFLDPMYNLGWNYNGKGRERDLLTPEEYLEEKAACFEECHRLLTDDGSLFVLINDEWADNFGVMLRKQFHRRAWIKWHEGFGTYVPNNFGRTTRHLFYVVKDPDNFVFNREAFTCKSWRQNNGDSRPVDDKMMPDLWEDIPRLTNHSAERVTLPTAHNKSAKTLKCDVPQLPLALVNRIVLGCSNPGDRVFDAYTGTGTTAVAAVTHGRQFIGAEKEDENVKLARARVRAALAEKGQKVG
jgi:site-specific DNA-methyltransferase (adenine-specific)